MRRRIKQRMLQIWVRHLRPILVLILIFTVFRSAIADWNDVPTGSMKPTIMEGDRILVNKLAYGLKVPFTTIHLLRWGKPDRGDIVVFYGPDNGVRMVKRVVGLPGDRVAMRNEVVYINGRPVAYEALGDEAAQVLPEEQRRGVLFLSERLGERSHAVMINPQVGAMRDIAEQTIPEGEYFLMGDNRDNSRDSRYFGTVAESQILGRASRVVFSLDYGDHYLPRGDRFLKSLP